MGVLQWTLTSLAPSLLWIYRILILNPQCKEGASDVNWRSPTISGMLINLKILLIFLALKWRGPLTQGDSKGRSLSYWITRKFVWGWTFFSFQSWPMTSSPYPAYVIVGTFNFEKLSRVIPPKTHMSSFLA